MSDGGGATSGRTSSPTGVRPALIYYLIVWREPTGSEVPHILYHSREEVLPVFSAREAAGRFLVSRDLGEEWYVREYSSGELVSVLFAYHERLGRLLIDPSPGRRLADHEQLWSPISRDGFIEFLIHG